MKRRTMIAAALMLLGAAGLSGCTVLASPQFGQAMSNANQTMAYCRTQPNPAECQNDAAIGIPYVPHPSAADTMRSALEQCYGAQPDVATARALCNGR